MGKKRRPQPLVIRLAHWVNVPVLLVMAMSGLQILRAYPYFGPQGAMYHWVPLQGWKSPDWLRAGQWLAGARHLHFALAWLLVANGIIYLAFLIASKEYRRRLFWPPRDLKPAIQQQLYYAKAFLHAVTRRGPKPEEPPKDLYNGLQRAAYSGAITLGILEVLSGLVIWKPVQLHWLGALMGGYDGARVVHFLGLLALAVFVAMHLVMVVVHWRQFPEMVTGGKPEEVER